LAFGVPDEVLSDPQVIEAYIGQRGGQTLTSPEVSTA
jgi:hypothetical protein